MKKNKDLKKEISQWDDNIERIIRKVLSEEEMLKFNREIGKNISGRSNPKESVLSSGAGVGEMRGKLAGWAEPSCSGTNT